ncbi:MAG: hypothetical protein ACOC0D_05020 [Spirochaeta sp.]
MLRHIRMYRLRVGVAGFVLLVMLAAGGAVSAQETEISYQQQITLDAATTLEAQATYAASMRVPLGGTGLLTQGNNVEFLLHGAVNPVSISGGAAVVFTPVAVLQLEAAAEAGSGWYLAAVDANGIGVLQDTADNRYSREAFDGAVVRSRLGAALQFDTGAVIDGDWTSLLMRSYHGLHLAYHTGAGSRPWEYMAVQDQLNGWSYRSDSVVAYQLPAVPVVQLAGVLFSTETRLTDSDASPVAAGGWGSDFIHMELGGVVALQPAPNHSLAVLVQWEREPDWENAETGLTARTLAADDPGKWVFWRAAVSYSFSF